MAARATARWEGSVDDGAGIMTTETGIHGNFTKASRFADGEGTSPEELVGAAHAGCFSQYLALLLSENDTPPTSIETAARVSIEVGDDGPTITRIDLSTSVDVDLPEDDIRSFADDAKANCPVSKALAGVDDVRLEVRKVDSAP